MPRMTLWAIEDVCRLVEDPNEDLFRTFFSYLYRVREEFHATGRDIHLVQHDLQRPETYPEREQENTSLSSGR